MTHRPMHRLSLLVNRFPRSVALAVAAVPPLPRLPGEQFDTLIGPWVDQVGTDRFRVSPLLTGAGQAVQALDEQIAVHRAVAQALVNPQSMHVDQKTNALLHGIQGRATEALRGLSYAMLRTEPRVAKEQKVCFPLDRVRQFGPTACIRT